MNEYDTEFESVSKSESGKNAYYLDDCKIVQHRPGYASCLVKVLDHRNHQRTVLGCDDCFSAIGKGDCIAVGMRKEEEIEGRALFFVDRTALQEQTAQQEAAAQERLDRQPPPQRNTHRRAYKQDDSVAADKTYTSAKPATTPSLLDAASGAGGDYAAAINMAIRTGAVSPAPTPVKTIPVAYGATAANVAKAGMSMVEIARAALAQKTL